MTIPLELRQMYRQNRLIPFIGAGVSMGVSWDESGVRKKGPSWGEMVELAVSQLGVTDPRLLRTRGSDLQILEYYKLVNHGVGRLTNWLYANMRPPDDALRNSAVHSALARLDGCNTFYTTNYDDFIERAFALHGRPAHTIAIEAHMGRNHATEVVKFHGDFNFPDSLVLTETDYQHRLRLESEMDFRLRSDLLGRGTLFIGFSFTDHNIAYIFWLVNRLFAQLPDSITGRRAYIVVADPSDFEMRLFRGRNIEILPVSRSTITKDIVDILEELRR